MNGVWPWVMAILAGLVGTGLPSHPADVEPVRYTNDDFGLRTVVPHGWTEVRSGVFSSGSDPPDRLIVACFPGMDRESMGWWLDATVPGKARLGTRSGEVVSDALAWAVYRSRSDSGDKDPLLIDLAIAEGGGGLYVVVLIAGEGKASRLRTSAFFPAVENLVPVQESSAPNCRRDRRHVFEYDSTAPLDLEVSNRADRGDFSEVTLSYASPMGGRVPATLLVPAGEGPFPGLIVMHGQSLSRLHWLPKGRLYAQSGAVVLLIDGPQHRPEPWKRPVVTFTPRDRQVQIQLIQDLRRGLDLLASRPDVKSDQLAYVGYSYGGSMGGLLAGVDHRLVAAALMVGDGGFVEHLTGFDDRSDADMFFNLPVEEQRVWREAMEPLEPLHFVASAAPAALLFQAALLDSMVPYPDAVRYQRAGSEPKEILWYRSGHILPDRAWRDQAQWLQSRIGIDASVFPSQAGTQVGP